MRKKLFLIFLTRLVSSCEYDEENALLNCTEYEKVEKPFPEWMRALDVTGNYLKSRLKSRKRIFQILKRHGLKIVLFQTLAAKSGSTLCFKKRSSKLVRYLEPL
jgi:hypothetical protein